MPNNTSVHGWVKNVYDLGIVGRMLIGYSSPVNHSKSHRPMTAVHNHSFLHVFSPIIPPCLSTAFLMFFICYSKVIRRFHSTYYLLKLI